MIIKYQKKKKINLNIFYERKCKRKKTEVKGKYLTVFGKKIFIYSLWIRKEINIKGIFLKHFLFDEKYSMNFQCPME